MSNEKFSQYFNEKSEMLEDDYAETIVLAFGTIIYASLLMIGLFWVPIPFLDQWLWVTAGSFGLVFLSILCYWRKHWKYSKFERWDRSQRRKKQ